MELGDLGQIILYILGLVVTAFASVKVVFKKVMTALDEVEDVVTVGGAVLKESAEALNAIVEAGKPDEAGGISFTAEEWANIKKEVKEVKTAADKFPKELDEAWTSIKAVFKKGPKNG